MQEASQSSFLKNLGFPDIKVHHSYDHFDFTRPGRRILVIGPMGSGKTEYSARVWRDSRVALKKSKELARSTTTAGADRRQLHFVRFSIDKDRFPDYPDDALAYRGGYERCGDDISSASDSFSLESILACTQTSGTFIIDEAAFYDERIAYLIRNEADARGLVFILPTLVLNFRKEIFNNTARLLLEQATDVFPLTAYCEHPDCIADSLFTYRYYTVDGAECPALYFDPLIIIGGDRKKADPREPDYCTRCDEHHYLPAKEYTYFTLKPLGESASRGDIKPLLAELATIQGDISQSRLFASLNRVQNDRSGSNSDSETILNALKVPCIAEKALCYLYAEQNLLSADQLRSICRDLGLDKEYLGRRLSDNRRPLNLE
ncbi:MAG: thymidine kinase [Spirochaetes bacterium]|nr:thymidine kinase [Spirochaetota bacterium]MBU0956115.1 thymidine kinase [Spirochaetota bacterium]